MDRAPALAQAGRYVEALAIYEEAFERERISERQRGYPLRFVVPVDPSRSIGLWEYVTAQVASWPEEGKAAYRRRADPLADYRFQGAKRAQDAGALEELIELYPLSSVVNDALGLIGNLYFDAGQNERAAGVLARLLAREGSDRAVVMAKLGLAWARAGRKDLVEELARRAEREIPGASVHIGGKQTDLAGHLKTLAAATREGRISAPTLALPSWEMLGGSPSGSRLAEPGVELSRLAWAETVGLPRLDADDEFGIRRGTALVPTHEFRPFFPAVSDGILYVHNGLTLSAFNFFARQPERLWQFRVAPPPGEVMFDNRVIYAPAVHEGRVFANLITAVGGAEDQLGYVRVKFPFPRRALFALDAYTGKLLWKLGGQLLKDKLEENASFATGPTPDGDRLYVGAIKQKYSTDPFEHHLLCIDAATGKVLWSTFVASGGTEINLFGNSTRESMGTPVTVTEDLLFYGTNHGVIAGLDKKTGRLRWTYQYRQLRVMPTRSVYVSKNPLEWVNSPPVASHGMVAFTPTDSRHAYGLDARTGQLAWERERGRDVRVMYGAREGTLVFGGDRVEFCDLRTGQPADAAASFELGGTGRGVVAPDGVYVPCRDMLRKVNWDGSWNETASRRWPGLNDGGNLLVVDGAVVMATQDSIQVYFDRRDQEKLIREALDREPDNASLLYRGALRYLQAGVPDHAAALLVRAVDRTSSSSHPEDERLHRAARKRLFAVSMEGGRAELESGHPDRAADRFTVARRYAADVPAQVEASLALARVYLVRKEDGKAVGEYQRLLLEHGEETVEDTRVFDLARNAIAAILSAVGRDAYAKHEAKAAELLAEGRRARTSDALARVFRLYPNSRAAEEALYESTEVFERLGREREEEQVAALRFFLRECGESARAPQAHATLARILERKGHYASAGSLLRRLVRLFPDAEISDGGLKVKARDFAEARLKTEAYNRPAGAVPPARLAPPLKKVFEYTDKDYPEGVALRVAGVPPPGLADRVLMHYAKHGEAAVKSLDPATGRAAWTLKLGAQVRFASYLEEALLVADDTTVVRLNPREGREPEWRYTSRTRMRGFALAGPLLIFFADDPRSSSGQVITALDTLRGTVAWEQPFDGISLSRIHPLGDTILFTSVSPERIYLLEVETGKRLLEGGAMRAGHSAQVIHAARDVLVVQAEGRFIEAYDLPAGTLRWRVGMERTHARAVEMGSEGLVVLGSQRAAFGNEEKLFLMTIHLRTGKIVRHKESPDIDDPRFMLLDGDQAVIVSRSPEPSITVRGVSLSDFSVRWTARLPEAGATLLPPLLSKDHVVVGMFEGDAQGKYAYGAALLDKTGRVVQNIKSEFAFERPPGVAVANDRLLFSVDSKVEVHR